MKNKIVYNSSYGGFGLSQKALKILFDRRVEGVEKLEEPFETCGIMYEYDLPYSFPRHHKELVKIVEELKEESFDSYASLKIKEIDGDQYIIDEHDGAERIVEPKDIKWIKIS